jgi:(2R)-3-sulfolactate dehydrogenase (NADP+)
LGLTAERLADAGLVTLVFANTPSAMAPWGGSRALFGTNPIAFAAPIPAGPPLVVDLALSEVARGKIMAAAEAGQPIPPGWANDRDGRPTTDARAALAGTLLPAGGAKGAALALMVEVLAAALTGGSFAAEASSFLDANGPPPSTGQLVVTIDPSAFPGGAGFGERLTSLAQDIATDGGARLPGSRRVARRREVANHGVAVPTRRLEALDRLAGR